MGTFKRMMKCEVVWRTTGSVACLLVLSCSILSQSESRNRDIVELRKEQNRLIDVNAAETQRRAFAVSVAISLGTEARSYKDLALRTRVLARAADTLWEADNITARTLFSRAWDAAETGDAEGATIYTKDNPPTMVIGLRKMSGRDLRVEVLTLVSRRDKKFGEQLLAKLTSEDKHQANTEQTAETSRNVFSGPENSLKRLLVAEKLLADDQVASAREFAAAALSEVNARSIDFLSQLRRKDAATADKIFAELLGRVEADPTSDANTVSGLSSYAFTPGFYVVFWPDGHSTWTQPEEPTVMPNLDNALRARFLQVAGSVLLRPVPPPDQDMTSCGRRGRLKVITRLLPLFEQYAPETATALRAQLTAQEGRNIDASEALITEGIRPENNSGQIADIEDQLARAKSSSERDQINAAAAAKLAVTGNKQARDFADSIDDAKFRTQVRNYVDFELIKIAIKTKNAAEVAQLAGAGELSHIQRSWSYSQAARLLLESERERALELLQEATEEAERMDLSDPDTSLAFLNVANQLLAVDRARAWEVLNKTVKAANSAADFTGDDIRAPKGSMLVTRNGTRFVRLPDSDFSFSRVLRVLAQDDLFRSLELAKSFKYEAARAYATLAIARAVLEKPAGTVTAKN
jgi:hypothetical protein